MRQGRRVCLRNRSFESMRTYIDVQKQVAYINILQENVNNCQYIKTIDSWVCKNWYSMVKQEKPAVEIAPLAKASCSRFFVTPVALL